MEGEENPEKEVAEGEALAEDEEQVEIFGEDKPEEMPEENIPEEEEEPKKKPKKKEEKIEQKAKIDLEQEVIDSLEDKGGWFDRRRGIIAIIIAMIVTLVILVFVFRPYISGETITEAAGDDLSTVVEPETNETLNQTIPAQNTTSNRSSSSNTTISSEGGGSDSSSDSGSGDDDDDCSGDSDCTSLNGACGYGACNSGTCEQEYNGSSVICRADAGDCDVVEYCTGSSASCPSNSYEAEGTVCSAGFCDGSGNCLGIQIDSCQVLNQTNKTYNLNTSIINNNLSGTCIEIIEENIILDCQDYSITSNQSLTGIFSNATETTIQDCNISMGDSEGGYGVYLKNANNSYVYSNILDSQYAGLFVEETSDSIIEGNLINENLNKGIHLVDSYNNSIIYNGIYNGSFYGILFARSADNLIDSNFILYNDWYGIVIDAGSGEPDGANKMINNAIMFSRENIEIFTSNNIVKSNGIWNSTLYNGIYLADGINNTIENNDLSYNSVSGLGLESSDNNTIINNTLDANADFGIEVYDSDGNIITNNTASSNLINGLYIEASSGNIINENLLCSNTADIYCETNQTFEDNTCDSGSVCGGDCESCVAGSSITGAVINAEDGTRNNIYIVFFILGVVVLTILLTVRRYYVKRYKG